jgi:hypothetical protein
VFIRALASASKIVTSSAFAAVAERPVALGQVPL